MHPLPISREEFARLFHRARPPTGWPARLAVANSGGPDSTCLLFLIQRFLADSPSAFAISSISVDHALQPSSPAMAQRAAATAATLRVPHTTSRIPWGTHPFPPLPDPSRPFESVARTARYHFFWKHMQKEDAGALALGHHSDDQVETALMRLGKKSSELGGRGMLACRRWGMGQANDLEWVGYDGMSKWIVRPLLEVSKDRILATCEENELDYVTDSTNFQPEITLRNALRSVISKDEDKDVPLDRTTLPTEIQDQLQAIDKTISSFPNLSIDLNTPPERLRAAVKIIDSFASDIENQATVQLDNARLTSPDSTFILATHSLQGIKNPILRRAMILRILRYISPQPWGSARAQARRSRLRIDGIVERVWHPSPLTAHGMRPFAAGSGVLWFPVLVDPSRNAANCLAVGGRIKRPNVSDVLSNEAEFGRGIVGWIASRQPPLTQAKQAALGLKDTLNVDITETLRDALVAWDHGRGAGPQVIQVLWDCRFLLSFDLALMPQNLFQKLSTPTPSSPIKIAIRWWTRYYLPKVVIVPPNGRTAWSNEEGKGEILLHSDIRTNVNPLVLHSRPKSLGKFMNQSNRKENVIVGNTTIFQSDWINSHWIRLLDSF